MRFISLGLGVAFGLMTAGTVFAADLMVSAPAVAVVPDSEWHPYVKAYGGATAPNNLTFNSNDYDVDAGWLLGGALGVAINENIAVELDGTYSATDYSGSGDALNGATFMANVVVSANVADQIAIYGGLGLGAVGVQYDNGVASDWGYGAGGQVFAGVAFNVTDNVSIFGEARYQSAFADITVDHDGHTDDIALSRTAVLGGVKLGF